MRESELPHFPTETPDDERKQDFDEAVRTYGAIAATYAEYGYDLVEIPRVTVEERVRFVLSAVV